MAVAFALFIFLDELFELIEFGWAGLFLNETPNASAPAHCRENSVTGV